MAERKHGGAWPYRGFTVRYHRLAGPDTVTIRANAPWWAQILDAPEIPPITGDTYAVVQTTAEAAIDALLAREPHAPSNDVPPRIVYQRLADYLATLPSSTAAVMLSFAEIEALLGGALPKTARREGYYWTHLRYRHVLTWTRHGWRARLRTREQAVVFTRPAAAPE